MTRICQSVDQGKLKLSDLWVTDGVHPHDPGYREFAIAVWDGYQAAVQSRRAPRVPAKPVHADTYSSFRRFHLAGPPSLPRGWSRGRPNLTAVNHDWLMSRWLDDLVTARNHSVDDKGQPRPEPQTVEPVFEGIKSQELKFESTCVAGGKATVGSAP